MAVKLKKFLGKSVQLTPGSCGFCGQDEDDEERFGKLIHKDNISVHYFCMLFASGLCQNGETEKHGIMGFLLHDILKEIRRASRLRCVYCKKNGATIGCVVTRCRVVFHLPCGLDNGILNQFSGRFCSYCEEHRPRQSTPSSDRLAFHGTAKSVCSICMSSVEARSSNTTLRTPCCKNAWFHKQCLQRHASCSGLHFFRCPLCNNKDIFQDEMLRYGIYIPDQDAAWEREPNAFDELLQRHSQCDSKTCKCPHGRDYSKNDTKWEIMLCDCCGSQGTHLCCGSLKTPMDDWLCTLCSEIIGQVTPKVKSKNKRVEKGKNKKAPVDKDWMEKKLQAMKQPTVPTGRGQKRKHSEIGATPDGGPKKKRAYKKRRSSTQTSTVTSSTPSASVEASHSQVRRESATNGDSLPGLELVLGNDITDKPKVRRTSKYLERKHASQIDFTQLTEEDLKTYPVWLRKLLNEDIFTGNNVGTKMAEQFPVGITSESTAATTAVTSCVNSDEATEMNKSCCADVGKSVTISAASNLKTKEPRFRRSRCRTAEWTDIIKDQDFEEMPFWYRKLMREDIFTGKNLGEKLKHQFDGELPNRNETGSQQTKETPEIQRDNSNSFDKKDHEAENISSNTHSSDCSFCTALEGVPVTDCSDSVDETSSPAKLAPCSSDKNKQELNASLPLLEKPDVVDRPPSHSEVMPILDKISSTLSSTNSPKPSSPKAMGPPNSNVDILSGDKTTPKFNNLFHKKSPMFKLRKPSLSPKLKLSNVTSPSSYKKIKSSPTIKKHKLDEMTIMAAADGSEDVYSPFAFKVGTPHSMTQKRNLAVTPVSRPSLGSQKQNPCKGLTFSPRSRAGSPRSSPRTTSPFASEQSECGSGLVGKANLTDKPRWFCSLMNEDILTGVNLGSKLATQFQQEASMLAPSPGSSVLPLSPQVAT